MDEIRWMCLLHNSEAARIKNAQDLFELAAPAEDLPGRTIDGILALTVGERGLFLDAPGRVFGVAPEDGEDGDVLFHADGIVARLSGNDEAAIDIKDGLHLGFLESDSRLWRHFTGNEIVQVILRGSCDGRKRRSAIA